MKYLPILFIAIAMCLNSAAASTVEDLLGPALSGTRTVYFRVVLEKKNGVDLRENAMPKEMLQALEKQGAAVRPVRTAAFVSYWIFFKNGDLAVCDVVDPKMTNLSYEKLVEFFADAPHDGPKWSREGDNLVIGERYYSVRVLPANDPATGGRKGEVEVAVVDNKEKIYYYFGSFISR
jgi:hypothetical protein